MTQWLKQSTAYTFQLGPFVDSTDGVTPETALTIAATDVDVSKAGAAFADKNDATALTGTGDAQGYYDCVLDATDTGTLGALDVRCYVSGALPVWKSFMVVPASVYNALVAGSAYLPADAVAISGDTTAADNAEAFFDGTGYAGTNNVIPTVTDVTNEVSADVTKISGDATAADNLEAAADGTGYNLGGGEIVAASVTAALSADVTKLAGSTTAADNLAASALAVISGEAATGTLTATQFTTNLTEATNDHYNGRVLVFTSGSLAGQAKAILDYDGTSKALTTRAFTAAPEDGDEFVIV